MPNGAPHVPPAMPEAEGLLTILEACSYLRISRPTIYEMMNRGDLPFIRLPGVRARRIARRVLIELVEKCSTKS